MVHGRPVNRVVTVTSTRPVQGSAGPSLNPVVEKSQHTERLPFNYLIAASSDVSSKSALFQT